MHVESSRSFRRRVAAVGRGASLVDGAALGRGASLVRRAAFACGAMLVCTASFGFRAAPARAEGEVVQTPFGNAADPIRPAPKVPEPSGPGFVSATAVLLGDAHVEERAADAGDLAAVIVDVRVGAASTTQPVWSGTVTASRDGGSEMLLADVCVLSRDAALAMVRDDGATFAAWNVTAGGQSMRCSGGTLKMALDVSVAGFRFQAPAGAELGARLLLLFDGKSEGMRRVNLPGLSVDLAPAKNAAASPSTPPAERAAEHAAETAR